MERQKLVSSISELILAANMYHAIVAHRVRSLFGAVNEGKAEPVLNSLANEFEHTLLGQSALGGTRTTLGRTRDWYGRLFRLLPDIKFDVGEITVSGNPAHTLVVAQWRESNSGLDGVVTTNFGLHVLHLRWGKVKKMIIAPDTTLLSDTLQRLGAQGYTEAIAPMIEG